MLTLYWRIAVARLSVIIILLAVPSAINAQIITSKAVTILPFINQSEGQSIHAELYRGFRDNMNLGSFLYLMDENRMFTFLAGRAPREVLRNARSLEQYATMTGSEFIIGGVVGDSPEGGLLLSIIVYSGYEQTVLSSVTRRYTDAEAALRDIVDLARYMSHPRHYTPSDSAFFYSFFLPGTGQLSLGRFDHTLVCWGLLSSALLYGVLNPQADSYVFPSGHFVADWDSNEEQWHFYTGGDEVTQSEYQQSRSAAESRAERAKRERASYQKRKELSYWFVGSVWLLNLADTLSLSKRLKKGGLFFSLIGSTNQGDYRKTPTLKIQLCIRFD